MFYSVFCKLKASWKSWFINSVLQVIRYFFDQQLIMGRYIERTVQRIAQDFLEERYRSKARRKRIFSDIEVRTKPDFGGNRADGLLAFRHWLWNRPYVVSMEAKSFKTLPAMQPEFRTGLFLVNCLRAGFIIFILTGGFFLYLRGMDTLQFSFPLTIIASGGAAYGLLTRNSFSHRVVDVIQQVKQYPANEYWLAFSDDSLASLSHEAYQQLLRICKTQGIGILEVQSGGEVDVLTRPRKRWRWLGDYVTYYSLEKEIRSVIVA